jgi:hypothetical protein
MKYVSPPPESRVARNDEPKMQSVNNTYYQMDMQATDHYADSR